MSTNGRRYVAIGNSIRNELLSNNYQIGDRLPTERDIAEQYGVSRTVIREAIIMLELEGLVEVRKGSGVYLVANIVQNRSEPNTPFTEAALSQQNDIGPFEMLQGRQLIESNLAEFAALNVTKSEIMAMRQVLKKEKQLVEAGLPSDDLDKQFHIQIAQASKNSLLIEICEAMWERREASAMWKQLHSRIDSTNYRLKWLDDHSAILTAMQRKDAAEAKRAMWQHLENVKQVLLKYSDVEDEQFDGYLFESYPLNH
jgi:GntR family uxuAB operon transcriptional repressor